MELERLIPITKRYIVIAKIIPINEHKEANFKVLANKVLFFSKPTYSIGITFLLANYAIQPAMCLVDTGAGPNFIRDT